MIKLHTNDALIKELQDLQRAGEIPALAGDKSRPPKIEPLAPLTRTHKLRLRFTRTLKVKAVAYLFSAIAAIAVGQSVQNIERGVTGYDPVKREQLLQKRANNIERLNARALQDAKQNVGVWRNVTYASLKQVVTDPKQFIENTDTYQSVLERYYNALKFIDDASFLIPAVLLFLMLGGYIERRINRVQEDAVEAEERERLRSKINELIDVANRLADGTGKTIQVVSEVTR